MALRPVRVHIPIEVAAATIETFVVEEQLPSITYLLNPQLFFWNTSVVDGFEVSMTQTMDFGAGADPLESGSFTRTIVSATTVNANSVVIDEDITGDIPPDNAIQIFKTRTQTFWPGAGEGHIEVPANLPLKLGTVTISWYDGAWKTMYDLPAGGWDPASDGLPALSSLDYDTGEIVLDTGTDIADTIPGIILISYGNQAALAMPFGDVAILVNDTDTPKVYHTISIENTDIVSSGIVRLLLTGYYDDINRTSILNWTRTTP